MPAPTISSISPDIGSVLGGASVTLTGADFTGTTGVTIGGVAATSVVVVSATSITCVTPAGSRGVASVVVTNGSGSNGANSLYQYIANVPKDTYIYLKGGRGDGFVPLWTGAVGQEDTIEQGEPYRNLVAGAVTLTGAVTMPGYVNILTPTSPPLVLGGAPIAQEFTPLLAIDDQLQDAIDGSAPPRKWDKTVTWLIFVADSGLSYKYRKVDVLGWGSQTRN